LKFEYDYGTVIKFYNWAESLSDDTDFVDYWYNLFLSETKRKIESGISCNINAFHWRRWKNDFEIYVDKYAPKKGDSYFPELRSWYAHYMQCLLYTLQISSKEIADFYGEQIFDDVTKMFYKYHCYGIDYFVGSFIEKYGSPVKIIEKVGM